MCILTSEAAGQQRKSNGSFGGQNQTSERSLPARTGGPNNVAYASFVEDDFRVGGVFLDLRTQAVHTQLEEFSFTAVVWTPDMLEQLGAAAHPALVPD